MAGREPTPAEFRDAAEEMDATGHHFLARELRAEADKRDARTTETDTDKEN
jgi:predicted phage gp36 major capsid-like protein